MDKATRLKIEKIIRAQRDSSPLRVLFVCLGNICRSPAAEGIMRSIIENRNSQSDWEIDSAGTGGYHIGELPDRRMRLHARNRGIELSHRCRQVSLEDFSHFDIIIGMDASNMANLKSIAPTDKSLDKLVPMSAFFSSEDRYDHVPDPYYEGAEGFELVLDLLQDACTNLFNTFQPSLGQ